MVRTQKGSLNTPPAKPNTYLSGRFNVNERHKTVNLTVIIQNPKTIFANCNKCSLNIYEPMKIK